MGIYDTKQQTSSQLLALVFLGCCFITGLFVDFLIEVPPVPKIGETNWGTKKESGIRPFKITVTNDELQYLNQRLNQSNYLTSYPGVTHQYGVYSKLLRDVVHYWHHNYNWREREEYLNQYPNYKTTIQGLDIHYVHVKPNKTKKSFPILMLHGWPGHFVDFYKIIPHLTNNVNSSFVFEVVLPSLAGFGFSDAPTKPGLGSPQQAVIFYNLMRKLGHTQFYVYGLDWGALIVKDMTVLYPYNILGLYSPLCISFRRISLLKYGVESLLSTIFTLNSKSKYSALTGAQLMWKEMGYFHFQGTKPDTIAAELNDNPIGVAVHYLQILLSGSNLDGYMYKEDGGLSERFHFDDLLDQIMIPWISKSYTSSLRFYLECISNFPLLYQLPIKQVPCACPKFLNEIFYLSDWILRDTYENLIERTQFDTGGHYYLFEKNKTLTLEYAKDLYKSVENMLKIKPVYY